MSDRAITRLGASLADRYRIERELGAGGMATVYLAHDRKHDRHVAIKVLRDDVAASVGRERFLREIQLAAKLSHPHILPLYDSGEADGALFYVMPNVQGESLRDRLDAQRQLPIHEAVRIASDSASFIATSSPRTSCCRTAMRWWPTSGSGKPSATRHRTR
jgi:serine/threonine protein kinase